FPLRVPPLRERREDIALLAQIFLDQLNYREGASKAFSKRCIEELTEHSWPGNVRELKNAVSRAFIMSEDVIEVDFARAAAPSRKLVVRDGCLDVKVGTPLAEVQREIIFATLAHFDGDKRLAAQALGVSLKTLYNRLEAYRTE
ncbi:MAG TPA: helix-turn-helix domain-containing protein, partial [Burkholderiaceae bacterium]|nr:helix-turn-helix domain-containing protein [Burkholderiaceae bacterium]